MTPSEDLFELIHSLTKAEKRHFKLFAERHVLGEENIYVFLFNAIEKQRVYDEPGLKKLFADRHFIKRLPAHKNYLYSLLLKSLRLLYEHKTTDLSLSSMMEFAEIFYLKKKYLLALKMLKRARKTALYYEKLHWLLRISSLEKKISIHSRLSLLPADHTSWNDTLAKDKELIREYETFILLENIQIQINHLFVDKGSARNKKLADRYAALMNQADGCFSGSGSITCQNIYEGIRRTYFQAIGNFDKSAKGTYKQIALMEEHPMLIHENPIQYKALLFNVVGLSLDIGNVSDAKRSLEKLRSLPVRVPQFTSNELKVEFFQSLYTAECYFINKIKAFEKVNDVMNKIEDGLQIHSKEMTPVFRESFYFTLAYFNFVLKKFRESVRWSNQLVNLKEPVRTDLQRIARVLLFLAHYELDNKDTLEYLQKSMIRYFENKDELSRFDKLLIYFIKTIAKIDKRQTDEWKKLRKEFLELKDDPVEKRNFEQFDFLAWIDSKIEKRSFADVLREKTAI